MRKNRLLIRLYFIVVLLNALGYDYSMAQIPLTLNDSNYISVIDDATLEIKVGSAEGLPVLNECLRYCEVKKDTLNTIKCLIGITDIDRFQGDYNNAFDKLWDALILANKIDHKLSQVKINRNLGILYSIFNKDSVAIEHLQTSLQIINELNEPDHIKKQQQNSSWFAMATIFRQNEAYVKALACLDSCQIKDPREFLPYVSADKGFIYVKTGKLEQAEKCLKQANQYFFETGSNYLAVTYLFTGDLMLAKEKTDSALNYFTESLKIISEKNVYLEYKPKVLQRLATIYENRADYKKAYDFILAAAEASQSLFDATSDGNSRLFEIKNRYKETLENQKILIEEQNSVIKEKEKILMGLFILAGLLFVISFSALFIYRLRAKLKKLRLNQKLDEEKNSAVLEYKSKELTTYTLQMIDMEKAVSELLGIIKTLAPEKYSNLYRKFAKGNTNLWEEFNMRFVEVNSNFYNGLRKKHPELTSTEQKHCALIKLNFDSNEMAQILNISLQSVHTSRYRIRKKLNLAHEDSLANYIAGL